MSDIAKCIRNFCEENSEKYTIYEGYSGRGMFGCKCLGIIVKNGNSYMEMIVSLTQYLIEDNDDACVALKGVSIDSLGLDTIVYFPRLLS